MKRYNSLYTLKLNFGKKHLFISFLILLLPLHFSCKKYVTVDPPVTQLSTATVFNTNSSATAAQTAIYSEMSSTSIVQLIRASGLSSDEFNNYSNDPVNTDLYRNALIANNDAGFILIWTPAYQYINQANAIIEGLKSPLGVSPAVKQQLTGEALFVRAFWHFYLVNFYGDVPLITTTDYKKNATASRTPVAQVYQQIIADLMESQNLLNDKYVDASDTASISARVRPNKWAATALLARTYLYTKDYKNAEIQSTSIINNTSLFSLESDLNNVFLSSSKEAIWQIMPVQAGYNTPEGSSFILLAPPSSSGAYAVLSDQLLGAFEPNDKRKLNWVGGYTDPSTSQTYYFPYKYKISSGNTITEYSMVLRLAEQYLIRAEAEANGAGNGLSGAINDLNIIRSRAGLPNYSGSATDKNSVLAAIYHERQVELFTEWGDRWLNMKRTGEVDQVMKIVTPQKGGIWNTYQQLYPIPTDDIKTGINLIQNPGY